MTRKEETLQAAAKLAKGAEGSRDHAKCLTYFVEGAEWADYTMLYKACEWLYNACCEGLFTASNIEQLVNKFKKSMEE